MDKTWHSHHFTCWSCETRFTAETGFHDYNGNPHCEKCYVDAACPKCKGCAKAITDKSVNAMGGSWHIDCFVCKVRTRLFWRALHSWKTGKSFPLPTLVPLHFHSISFAGGGH